MKSKWKEKKDLFIRKVKNIIRYSDEQKKGKKIICAHFSENSIKKINGEIMSENEKAIWLKSFLDYNVFRPDVAYKSAQSFCNDSIEIVKNTYMQNIPKDEPILVCNVRDDIDRIKMSIKYHREMGVKYFAIMDNCSQDGTYEWLLEQDIDVFTVKEQYTSVKRVGWITKVADYYGFDRWFIILDSDELLTYRGIENNPIQSFIRELCQNKINRVPMFMLDMYANENDLEDRGENIDIESKYNLFDTDSYIMSDDFKGILVYGGPRERYFGKEAPRELLTKYPIVFLGMGEIYCYHYVFPFEQNFDSEIKGVLRHYKFINGDIDKYKRIVKEGNYAGGSALYKKYLEKMKDTKEIDFVYEGTAKYHSSEDLKNISIMP